MTESIGDAAEDFWKVLENVEAAYDAHVYSILGRLMMKVLESSRLKSPKGMTDLVPMLC